VIDFGAGITSAWNTFEFSGHTRFAIMPRVLLSCAVLITLLGVFVYACSWDNPVWPKNAKSDTPLFRFVVGIDHTRAGYIDANGKIVIPPLFESYGNYGDDDFFNGIALLRANGQNWYVNAKGKKLFRSRNSGPFSEGLATFQENGKMGYLDKQGRVSIPPSFEQASSFSEELAAAAIGERYGYINRTGSFVIQPRFVLALPFRNGVARVVKQSGCLYIGYDPCSYFNPLVLPFTLEKYQRPTGKEPPCTYSFIDRAGRDLFPTRYREAKDFAEGLAPVGDGQQWGYVDGNGRLVVPLQYQSAEPFSEGLAVAQIRGKWGYVDHAGKWVIPATFARALGFSEGVGLTIDAAGQYRFIDKRGMQTITGSFTGASSFVMGRAHVRTGSNYETATWEYIDHAGHAVFRYSANGRQRPPVRSRSR
jgi:WG containing repeat